MTEKEAMTLGSLVRRLRKSMKGSKQGMRTWPCCHFLCVLHICAPVGFPKCLIPYHALQLEANVLMCSLLLVRWPKHLRRERTHTHTITSTQTYFPPQQSFVVITRLDLLRDDRQTHQRAILKKVLYSCSQKDVCAGSVSIILLFIMMMPSSDLLSCGVK